MRLLFEDDLVEASLVLCRSRRGPEVAAMQVRRFEAQRERCYAVLDPDERTAAFARVHLEWFGEWGLRARLEEAVGQFPSLPAGLVELVFRRSRGRQDEGAELYGDRPGRCRGVVALRPERLTGDPGLAGFLHHELAHLVDMVDEDFGYVADLDSLRLTPSQLRLVRERYRLLWSIRIDGRLAARALAGSSDEPRRRAEFDRAFAFLPAPRRAEVFAKLWGGVLSRHSALLGLAADPRELNGRHDPIPGAACPLCGFAAFRWVVASSLRPEARQRIQAEFPSWSTTDPVCSRCGEIYDSLVGLEYPTTVCLS